METLSILSLPAAGVVVFAALSKARRNLVLAAELCVLVLASLLLPPLVFFVLYFCCLLSPSLLIDAVAGMKKSAAIPVGVIVTLITVAAGVAIVSFLPEGPLDERIIQITSGMFMPV